MIRCGLFCNVEGWGEDGIGIGDLVIHDLGLLTFLRLDSLDRYASSSVLLGYSGIVDTVTLW